MKKLIRERSNTVECITLIALMSAINAITSLISYFLPIGGLILLLIVPLTSVVVVLSCKNKYIIIYIASSLVLSVAVTAWDLLSNLIFVLPALITGVGFGVLQKLKTPSSLAVITASLINVVLVYFSLLVVKISLEIDYLSFLCKIVGIQERDSINKFIPSLILLYSLIQCSVVQLFIFLIGERFDIKPIKNPAISKYFPIFTFVLAAFSILLSFVLVELALFFIVLDFAFGIACLEEIIRKKNKSNFVSLVVLSFISFFTVPIILPYLQNSYRFLLLLLLPISIAIASLFNGRYTINTTKKGD